MSKKERCPVCKRLLRVKNFVFNRVEKKQMCSKCDKHVGHNVYFRTDNKDDNIIGNFSITKEEKKILARKKGWKAVNKDCAMMKEIKHKVYKVNRINNTMKESTDNSKKELHKKFIEGLK